MSYSFYFIQGVNGQNQSLTIITFDFNTSQSAEPKVGKCGVNTPQEKKRFLVNNDLGTVAPLNLQVYDCGYPIPEDGKLDGYPTDPANPVLKPVTCTFCDEVCEAPDIDATINLFDGCDWDVIKISYGIFAGLTVLLQIYIFVFKNPKDSKELVN